MIGYEGYDPTEVGCYRCNAQTLLETEGGELFCCDCNALLLVFPATEKG